MHEYIEIGDILFHKYLGNIKITSIDEDGLKADTGKRGILEFKFYDFGKVLYLKKEHSYRSFKTYTEYLQYFQQDIEDILEEEERKIERQEEKVLEEKEEEHIEQEKQRTKKKISIFKKVRLKINQLIKRFFNKEPQRIEKTREIQEERFQVEEQQKQSDKIEIQIKENLQEESIAEIINRRNIKYLFHFTRIENLPSILENGFYSVKDQEENNEIYSIHNDENRLDGQKNCTSFSVSFPNYKLLSTFKDYKFFGTKWVVIVVDANLLLSEDRTMYFCNTNAAHVMPKNQNNKKSLSSAKAFENMFCDTIITKENKKIYRKELKIPDCYTTDPQAEILIGGIIEPRFIRYICFNNAREMEGYLKKNNYTNKNKYKIVSEVFNDRKDYQYWQKGV